METFPKSTILMRSATFVGIETYVKVVLTNGKIDTEYRERNTAL